MTTRVVRQTVLLAAVGAFVLCAPRIGAQTSTPPRERQIFVTVLDASGVAVKDLAAGDLSVREGTTQRKVTHVEQADDPLSVALLIDTTLPPPGATAGTQDIRKALASFVAALLSARESTVVSLTQFAGAAVTTVPFTESVTQLQDAIQKIYGGPQTGGVLFEALMDASAHLGRRSSPRRAIVSIDFDSAESSRVLPSQVLTSVHDSGATLWALSVQRSGDTLAANIGAPVRQSLLSKLPGATGGQHLRAIGTSSLEAILLRIADILTHQYLVTYASPEKGPASSITPASSRGSTVLMAPWVR